MTPALPSIEAPEPGSCCPECKEPLAIVGWCACGWDQLREAAIEAQLHEARKRARAWQLGRAVQA